MDNTIQLNGTSFQLDKTIEGEKLLQQLHVNLKRVEAGKNDALIQYGYCMLAGAAKAAGKEFPLTVEQFRKAMPVNWKTLFIELVHLKVSVNAAEKTKSKQSREEKRHID